MNVAMCAAFLKEDVWESRLMVAAFPLRLELTECNSAKALMPLMNLKSYDLIVVALEGALGLEAVQQLRCKAPNVPLLWISDEDYSLYGYQYRITYFLRCPVTDAELRVAVTECLRHHPRTVI